MVAAKSTSMPLLSDLLDGSGVAFGTSGARGLVSAMTDEICAAYTQSFIHALEKKFRFQQIAIAVDLRPSSPAIANACAKMARQLGYSVVFCGPIPTPALALYAQKFKMPGIMVTGSHIPFDRNGLKFYRPDGEITKADEQQMLATPCTPLLIKTPSLPEIDQTAKHVYIQRYISMLGTSDLKGMRLAIYEHSAVGRDIMHSLFTSLGAEVILLERSDTFIPIDTEAVTEVDVQRGIDWAKLHSFDAVLSTDGDGDRPLIGDERGVWLRGDIVGLLTARVLGATHLAVPVSCNTCIETSAYFSKVLRTKIGSPYVIAGMQALQAEQGDAVIAGFEANGGFLLGSSVKDYPQLDALPTRDAILPMIALLSLVKMQKLKLSELVNALPKRFTASDRIQGFPTERSKTLISKWSAFPDELVQTFDLNDEVTELDMTDGLRVTLCSGRILHLRPSGNAPEFRCYVETSSEVEAKQWLAELLPSLGRLKDQDG